MTAWQGTVWVSCMAGRTAAFQKKFRKGQQAHLLCLCSDPRRLQVSQQGRSGHLRYGGVWSERILTITLPGSGNADRDVRELQRAWTRFIRLIRLHIEKDLLRHDSAEDRKALMKYVSYCRVLEVPGPGADGHIRFWFVSPFIHRSVVAHLWGKAIAHSYKNMLSESGKIARVDDLVAKLPAARKEYAERLRDSFVTYRGDNGARLSQVWAPTVHVDKMQSGAIAAELCGSAGK